MYVITDNKIFLGKDFRGRPNIVTSKAKASVFKTETGADNYLKHLPEIYKNYQWQICWFDDAGESSDMEIKTFGNPTKTTTLEDEDFDICDFFSKTIEVMSQIDRYISNMMNNEQIVDMKILDIRHYIRDNNHKLNAIQMQRLGYYLQDLEKERYRYKSNRLIASMFAYNIEALKDKGNIEKMQNIMTSKYNPKILGDTDIEHIINMKKENRCEIILLENTEA